MSRPEPERAFQPPTPWAANFQRLLQFHGADGADGTRFVSLNMAIDSADARLGSLLIDVLFAMRGEIELEPLVNELDWFCETSEFRRSWTDGLALRQWQAPLVLVKLDQLRMALRGLGWMSVHEDVYGRVLETAFQTATPAGWAHPTGSLLKYFQHASEKAVPVLKRAVEEAAYRRWRPALAVLPRTTRAEEKPSRRLPAEEPLDHPGFADDETRIHAFRTEWTSDSAFVGLQSYPSNAKPRADAAFMFRVGGRTVAQGVWQTEVFVAGRKRSLTAEWQNLCRVDDDDGTYLELRYDVGPNVVLERQIFLARKTPVLLLADTLKSTRRTTLALEWSLPLATADGFEGIPPTRARTVCDGPTEVRLLPVGAPASPLQPLDDGDFSMTAEPPGPPVDDCASAGRVALRRERVGRTVFLPIVLTWGDERPVTPASWRRLTVTSDRRAVGPDEAVAFRATVEGRPFTYFRRFIDKPPHPVRYAYLGHQTQDEAVIGEMDSAGDMKTWLRIEG
ncbi:MAG: hypothetical protein ACRDD1_20000 [Planctomycetia bacterium]